MPGTASGGIANSGTVMSSLPFFFLIPTGFKCATVKPSLMKAATAPDRLPGVCHHHLTPAPAKPQAPTRCPQSRRPPLSGKALCPVVAQSGHPEALNQSPRSGLKRPLGLRAAHEEAFLDDLTVPDCV